MTAMADEDDLYSNQWMFTAEEISSSPSILHGITPEEERTRRAKGVNFIVQAGVLMRFPQVVICTAAVFFHRFYMRQSMVTEKNGIHHYVRSSSLPRSRASISRSTEKVNSKLTSDGYVQNIAATALFLASKAEETCRKTKDIVIAVARVAQKNPQLEIDDQNKEFWRWRDNILLYEELMLEMLTFDVVLKSPYEVATDLLKQLGYLRDLHQNKALRDRAWAFLNDSCTTTLCLRMTPRDIAIAAIYFSARYSGEKIKDSDDGRPWWEPLGGRASRIAEAVEVMRESYAENPLNKPDVPYNNGPGASEDDLEKSRLRHGVATPESLPHAGSIDGSSEKKAATNGTNGHQKSMYRDTSEKSPEEEIRDSTRAPGDSDKALKEAANNPNTHIQTGLSNGLKRTSVEPDLNSRSPKRARVEQASTSEDATTTSKPPEEASEEGELEE